MSFATELPKSIYDNANRSQQRRSALSFAYDKLRWIALIFLLAINGNSGAQTAIPSPASPQIVRVAVLEYSRFPARQPIPQSRRNGRKSRRSSRHTPINADVIVEEEVRDLTHATIAVSPLTGSKLTLFPIFRHGKVRSRTAGRNCEPSPPLSAWVEMWKPNGALVPPVICLCSLRSRAAPCATDLRGPFEE